MKMKTKKERTNAGGAKIALSLMLVCSLALSLVACTSTTATSTTTPDAASAVLPVLDSDINTSAKAEISSKKEIIYAMLDYGGTVEEAYAINNFTLSSEGSFSDYGSYSAVENLTNTEPIDTKGDEIALAAAQGEFYYQGTVKEAELPWQISFSYTLDGKKIDASEVASLGGQSGRLGIHIATSKTPSVTDTSFYEHYTLQISLTLPSAQISHLSAPSATIAYAGSNTQVSYVVLPDRDASYDLEVDFENINMAGISIAAVPYGTSFEIPETSGVAGELGTLVSSINTISASTTQINSGLGQAATGLKELADGSTLYNSGLLQLNGGSATLGATSSTLSGSLASIVNDMQLLDLTTVPEPQKTYLQNYIAGLAGVSGGYTALNDGIQEYTSGVGVLANQYSDINNGIAQSASGVGQLSSGMGQLTSGAEQLSSGVQTMPEEMQAQIDEIAASYDFSGFEPRSFFSSKNSKVELVQFVLITPAIELPEEPEEEEKVRQESSILDKFIALFTGE